MNRRKGLGSGFDVLLPPDLQGGIREVSIQSIRQNSRQPRMIFDQAGLEDLAASIREHGILQPLIVSERSDGIYELVAGERRWRAAQLAGVSRVPVVVRETTPQQLLEWALIENVQRADLNPIEEARAYQALVDDFGLTDNQVAQRVGKNNRVTVANTRRLLKLPQQVQDAILKNRITAGHGRALLKLDTPQQQLAALEAVISEEFSVREAERLGDLTRDFGGDVQQALAALRRHRTGRAAAQPASSKSPDTAARKSEASENDRAIGRELERLIGTPVGVSRADTQLRLTITFHDDEKLQEFFAIVRHGIEHMG